MVSLLHPYNPPRPASTCATCWCRSHFCGAAQDRGWNDAFDGRELRGWQSQGGWEIFENHGKIMGKPWEIFENHGKIMGYPMVMTNSLPWYRWPIFKFGKPSISMGHLYHGYVK